MRTITPPTLWYDFDMLMDISSAVRLAFRAQWCPSEKERAAPLPNQKRRAGALCPARLAGFILFRF